MASGLPNTTKLTSAILATLLVFSVLSISPVYLDDAPVDAQVPPPTVTLGGIGGANGVAVEDGTAVFGGFGNCPPDSDGDSNGDGNPELPGEIGYNPGYVVPPVPAPGEDCHFSDNVVRTNDTVSYGFSVGIGGIDDGESMDDVNFTQTITPTADADIEFVAMPNACQTGTAPAPPDGNGQPYNPQSSITVNADNSITLVCNLGRLDGPSQTVFLRSTVRVQTTSTNNESFTSTTALCEDGAGAAIGCQPTETNLPPVDTTILIPDETTWISAQPRFDLAKNKRGPSFGGAWNNPGDPNDPNDDQLGLYYLYYITIEADAAGDGKGQESLSDPLTFNDIVYVDGTTTPVPGVELMDFQQNGNALTPCLWNTVATNIPFGKPSGTTRTLTNSTADSGTITCSQAAPGAPININVTGIDTSGSSYPDLAGNNSTALTPPYYVGSYWIRVWYPFESIDRYDPAAVCDAADTAAGFTAPFCGEVNGVGDLPVQNCVGEFDPVSANGVSNYGDGVEPGEYGSGTAGTNNCRITSLELRTRGSYSKHIRRGFFESAERHGIISGQTASHSGDGPVEPGQYYASTMALTNSGTNPLSNVAICDKVDNMINTVAPIQEAWYTGNQPAYGLIQRNGSSAAADRVFTDVVLEYASGPAGTVPPAYVQWDNDHLAGGLGPGGQYNSSTFASQQSTTCDDADGNWSTDPYSFDANPADSLQKIRAVRVRLANGQILNPGDQLWLDIQMQARNTFFGGPHDGDLIPAGVLNANYSIVRSDQLWTNWASLTGFDANTDRGFWGDRLIFNRGFVRLAKHTIPVGSDPATLTSADYDQTSTLPAGDPVWFRLEPAAISNGPNPGDMTNVQVVDVLPTWLTFDLACTANIIQGPLPIVQLNTPNPGETTLTWNLGTVTPNTQLPPIDFCTVSDSFAADGTDVVNRATISAAEDASTEAQRSSTATVELTQLGGFLVRKTRDDFLDPVDNNQIWILRWANFSDFVILDGPTIIDVIPHNNDDITEGSGAPRDPGSDFTGTLQMNAKPVSSVPGTFYFTKRNASDVSFNPEDPSNNLPSVSGGGTDDGVGSGFSTFWCTDTDFGNFDCPASFQESTGFMFVASGKLNPGDIEAIRLRVIADGNEPGDVYSNRFGANTPSLQGQLNVSNTPRIWVAGVSVGDFVWFDWDDDGQYEPTAGETPIPDGVTINLRDATNNALVETTTTVNGRYVFKNLPDGEYYVEIPATEFAAGAPLFGFVPSTPVTDPNTDQNEGVDQHGKLSGGAVITDPIEVLAGTVPEPSGNIIVQGNEPLGDDVASIDIFSQDALSNLTLDIGLRGEPDIELTKLIAGVDANGVTGPVIPIGSPITWTFEVENTGDILLNDVTVVDNQLPAGSISCDNHLADTDGDNVIDQMVPGDTVSCTATGTSVAGQYTNVAGVSGTDPGGEEVSDSDPANYFGATTGIDIEKKTLQNQADTPNGPTVGVGNNVNWQFEVTNTGNVDLADVTVTDNVIAAADIDCGDGTNVIALLEPGVANTVTCTASGDAVAGQHANTATATGSPVDADGDPVDLDDPTDDDPSHYFGVAPDVDIEKLTNGQQADSPSGPLAQVGSTVTWTFIVENEGNVPLADVTVTDNQLANAAISCATHLGDSDGNNVIDLLRPTEQVTCTATGTAIAGQYANTGSVVGVPIFPSASGTYDGTDPSTWPSDPADYRDVNGVDDPTDTDDSHYYGWDGTPALDIEKSTNGFQADNPAGPFVAAGGGVMWEYVVENTGDVPLLDVLVTDNVVAGADIECENHRGDNNANNTIRLMLPGDIVTCVANGTAIVVPPDGQYANTGNATGTPVFPENPGPDFDPDDPSTYPSDPTDYEVLTGLTEPSDSDDSHYFSADLDDPAVDIEKATNGLDADNNAGPYLVPGTDTVTWTFVVENTGGYTLAPATITDNQLADTAISCDAHHLDPGGDNVIDVLLIGDSVTCTASATAATFGQYSNTAMVSGDPVVPRNCTSCDPADPSGWPKDPSAYVDATDAAGDPIPNATESDPSHYFGAVPSLDLEKETQDFDADTPTGPLVVIGNTVTWSYYLHNDGNVPLVAVTVADVPAPAGGISCDPINGDTDGDNVVALLLPGDRVTCTATGIATEGQFANEASVTSIPAAPTTQDPNFDPSDPSSYPTDPADYTPIDGLDPSEDSDPSHYVGVDSGVDVEKATNGEDADVPTGPFVVEGDTVTWTYRVENTGFLALSQTTVTDSDPAVTITCPVSDSNPDGDNVIDILLPGEVVVCTASAPATGTLQYANTASVSGRPAFPLDGVNFDPDDPSTWPTDPDDYRDVNGQDPAEDADDSHYVGVAPGVDVEKATNGEDADVPTGPFVIAGSTVTWTYDVTNSGNVALTDVSVTDSDPTITITCPVTATNPEGDNVVELLLPGESVTCTASAPAIDGLQYSNTATVTGTPSFPTDPPDGFDPSDPSTYPTDPSTYGPVIDPETGEPTPPPVDTDDSHYVGSPPDLAIEKATEGVDADDATGPALQPGDPVTWTYDVVNGGTTALTNVVVTDVPAPPSGIDCGDGTNTVALLLPGQVVTCTATGTVAAGIFRNDASVSGQPSFPTDPPAGFDPSDPSTYPTDPAAYGPVIDPATGEPVPPLDAADPSHHYGAEPGVGVVKMVNGDDANEAPGAQIDIGTPITWTYEVTNTGNTALNNVAVDDDQGLTVSCPSTFLLPGQSMTCTASGVAEAGEYVNIGTVTGDPVLPIDPPADWDPNDPATWPSDPEAYEPAVTPTDEPLAPVNDDDPAHHFGNGPAIELTKDVCTADTPAECDPTDDSVWGESSQIKPGQVVTWRITVSNTGNVDLADVEVSDDTVASCSQTIGLLPVGAVEVITCSDEVAEAFVNTASVTAKAPSCVEPEAAVAAASSCEVTDSDDATLIPPAELELAKSVSADNVEAGAEVTFTIEVTNSGVGPANDTVVLDRLPEALGFVATDGTAGAVYNSADHTIEWTIGTLEPGATVSLSYTVTVEDTQGGVAVNSASVASTTDEIDLGNNQDEAMVTASPPQRIAFTGSTIWPTVYVAMSLLAMGMFLVLEGRRRRRWLN